MHWAMAPSLASRAAFLAAVAMPRLAQDVDGGVEVALGFDQRLLAVHHAGVGHFAQFGDQGGSDFSHSNRFEWLS